MPETLNSLYTKICGANPPGTVTGFEVWNKDKDTLYVAFFILRNAWHHFEIVETNKKLQIARVLVENTGQYCVSEDRTGTRLELWEAPFTY